MRTRIKRIFITLATVFLVIGITSGCATVFLGGKQKVGINSTPTSATVKIYDYFGSYITQGKTPFQIQLEAGDGFFRQAEYRVVIERKGYEPFETRIRGSLNGWYLFGNILVGGVIGWFIVDPATGAMWELHPNQINANLQAE